ncbi:118_t:CDS:2, partial [Acaulospora colombiana]
CTADRSGIQSRLVDHVQRHLTTVTFKEDPSMESRQLIMGSPFSPGPAIWIQGVVIGGNWRDRGTPNVSFTLDGIESPMQTVETNDQDNILYNVTLFQASNLSNKEHTLCIQTHDNSSFLLDSITYTSTSSLAAAVNETTATITDSPESTFPYSELPPSQSPNAESSGSSSLDEVEEKMDLEVVQGDEEVLQEGSLNQV